MTKKLFAVPTVNGKMSGHFGRCEKFSIVEVENDKIINEFDLVPPEHQPGVYPNFLAGKGISAIIAGGMGPKAQQIFTQNGIEVIMGAASESPADLVLDYLNNSLQLGDNTCDH